MSTLMCNQISHKSVQNFDSDYTYGWQTSCIQWIAYPRHWVILINPTRDKTVNEITWTLYNNGDHIRCHAKTRADAIVTVTNFLKHNYKVVAVSIGWLVNWMLWVTNMWCLASQRPDQYYVAHHISTMSSEMLNRQICGASLNHVPL